MTILWYKTPVNNILVIALLAVTFQGVKQTETSTPQYTLLDCRQRISVLLIFGVK